MYSETSKHLNLSFVISLKVPPELINSILYFAKTFKRSSKFSLLETEISAFLIFFSL